MTTELVTLIIVYSVIHILVVFASLWAGAGAQERLQARHERMLEHG